MLAPGEPAKYSPERLWRPGTSGGKRRAALCCLPLPRQPAPGAGSGDPGPRGEQASQPVLPADAEAAWPTQRSAAEPARARGCSGSARFHLAE